MIVMVQFVGVTNSSFGVFYSFFMNLVFMTHFLVIDDSCDSCHMTHRSGNFLTIRMMCHMT